MARWKRNYTMRKTLQYDVNEKEFDFKEMETKQKRSTEEQNCSEKYE